MYPELEAFFKTYYTTMKEYYVGYWDDFGLTEDNYWAEVMKPTDLSEDVFDTIETQLAYKLPECFKAFYRTCYSLEKDIDTGGLFIAGNREEDKLSSLVNYFFEQSLSNDIRRLKLLPFGLYNDEWYVCLDYRSEQREPSISLFEMSNWGAGNGAISHRPWFSNFGSFIKCITDYIETGNWGRFDEIDPGNNYLNAYDYWVDDLESNSLVVKATPSKVDEIVGPPFTKWEQLRLGGVGSMKMIHLAGIEFMSIYDQPSKMDCYFALELRPNGLIGRSYGSEEEVFLVQKEAIHQIAFMTFRVEVLTGRGIVIKKEAIIVIRNSEQEIKAYVPASAYKAIKSFYKKDWLSAKVAFFEDDRIIKKDNYPIAIELLASLTRLL